MINVDLMLHVGYDPSLTYSESFKLKITNPYSDVEVDSINDLLAELSDTTAYNYAELRLHVTGVASGFLVGCFKQIKLKNKGCRWVVVD